VHLVFEAEASTGQNLPETLERYTENTIVDRNLLREHMSKIGESGYAVECGEFIAEISAAAVPIRDYTRSLVGTLAVVGPSHRLTEESIHSEVAPALLKAGSELSRRLGFHA
jgi:DNA-binding IclR family transcriptional regulator